MLWISENCQWKVGVSRGIKRDQRRLSRLIGHVTFVQWSGEHRPETWLAQFVPEQPEGRKKQLHCPLNSSDVASLSAGGNRPHNRLFWRTREVRASRVSKISGMRPVSRLYDKSKVFSFSKVAKVVGMRPVS